MNKFGTVFGIIVSLSLIGLGIYGIISSEKDIENSNTKIEEDNAVVPDIYVDKTLICVKNIYDNELLTNADTTITITFVNDNMTTYNSKVIYQYNDLLSYQEVWKTETVISGSYDEDGIHTEWNIDETNLRYIVTSNGLIDDMINSGWRENDEEIDTTYDGIKNYYAAEGLNCK